MSDLLTKKYCSEGLDAPKDVEGEGVYDELDPFKDKEFLRAFTDSKLPVHQIGLVYKGWLLFRNNVVDAQS